MAMVSPNDLLQAAKDEMLDGNEPATTADWVLVMNFVAANVHPEVRDSACKVIRVLYKMPLTEETVAEIVAFQAARS